MTCPVTNEDSSEEATVSWLRGAYRLHKESDVTHFTALAAAAFPAMQNRIRCFGADWLGRQFATDFERIVGGEPQVLMLEPGTGEILEVPRNFSSFHQSEMAEQPDAVVANSFFETWLATGGVAPNYDQCVGYKQPLFLGGMDDITNLHITDFDVYWTISAQLLAQVRGLPESTRVSIVGIDD